MIEPHKAMKAKIGTDTDIAFSAKTKGTIMATAMMCDIGMIHYNITSGAVYAI
jgi:hypothetical protein